MKYKLIMILDYASKELAESLFNFGKGWPLFRDHDFQLVDEVKYNELVNQGEISDSTYWRVKKYGLIMKSRGTTYSGTYEKLKQGLSDYQEGWNAAMRVAKPEIEVGRLHRPWEEIIKTPKKSKQVKLGKVSFSC